jgi:GT2 family glycosyltransferase
MKVTIIIPYKEDRGWLKDAIDSVPKGVQLILSKGDGNWPQNFNKVLKEVTGDYIKYLHEDDMLTPNCIEDSIRSLEGFDFIHGNAIELFQTSNDTFEKGIKQRIYRPTIKLPTLEMLLKYNSIHSATTMYRREVFEKIGGFNEDNKCYSFEEYEFNLRVLKAGFKIGYCNSELAFYRRHPKQIIRTCNIQERKQYRQELINTYND